MSDPDRGDAADAHENGSGTDDADPHYVGKITQKAVLFGPDGDVLVTRSDGVAQPPGGTFERGETLVAGLRRALREECGVDARVGPPVEALYGGWVDEDTGDPMVTLVYRCETDDRGVTPSDAHDASEWLPPAEAADRFADASPRLRRAVERAAALDGAEPFAAVTDPYEGTDESSEAVLARLATLREADPDSFVRGTGDDGE